METKKLKRKRLTLQSYGEEFKWKVCDEYLCSGVTKVFLLKKYNIRYRSAVQKWMQVFGYEKSRYLDLLSTPVLAQNKFTKLETQDMCALEKRVKELEIQLEDEQLRSEAYSHKVVGYHVAETLERIETIKAL
jgi:transposase